MRPSDDVVPRFRARWHALGVGALLAFAAGHAAVDADAATPGGPPQAVSQSGVLRLHGCVLQPKEIALTAAKLKPAAAPGARANGPDDEPDTGDDVEVMTGAHRARLSATADPHVFGVVIQGLKPDRLYMLDVSIPAGRCANKVTWIGPARGVFAPGAQPSLDLKGFALTTQIDVPGVDEAGQPVNRAADALSQDDFVRRFRWRSDLAGVVGAELQISSERFPSATEGPATCAAPPGLLATVPLAAQGDWSFSPAIDFSQALPVASEINQGEVDIRQSIPVAVRQAFRDGAPLYIRAIPMRADGVRLCDLLKDGAAATAVVQHRSRARNPLAKAAALEVTGTFYPAQDISHFDYCVTSVSPHQVQTSWVLGQVPDIYGMMFQQQGQTDTNGWVNVGSRVCWNTGSPSAFDVIGDFATGFVDAIASIVNFVANLYNSIKADVVDLVASALTTLGIPCEATCKGIIDGVISTALTSMGLPPSLPDFDALVNDGVDYLKAKVAEQTGATGLTKLALDQLTDATIDAAKQQAHRGGGGGLPDWLVADNGFRPARVVLNVSPNPLKLNEVPDRLYLRDDTLITFTGVDMPLPLTMRTEKRSFTIPVQLPPNLLYTANMPCPPWLSSCVNSNSYWPPEVVLKLKLGDWYLKRVAGSSCWQFSFHGDPWSGSSYGIRAVEPQRVYPLGAVDMFCG